MGQDNIIVWNVQGLNSRARQDIIHELVAVECPSLISLQETKLNVLNDYDVL
jgi:exonuclease III